MGVKPRTGADIYIRWVASTLEKQRVYLMGRNNGMEARKV